MKKTYGFLALAGALALASCSNDDFSDLNQGTENEATKAYINVSISMNTNGTRADNDNLPTLGQDFQYGTEAENEINSLVLGFYDANGGLRELVSVSDIKPAKPDNSNNIAVTVPVTGAVSDGTEAIASQVVAFVNIPISYLTGKNLAEVQKVELPSYNPGTGFAMSSVGYYGDGTNYSITTPVTADDFYKVGETNSKAPVEIYIERVAAKVELKSVANIEPYKVYPLTEDGELGSEFEITFNPAAWDVQAYSKKSYVNKQNAATLADPFKAWVNDLNNHRSYWAQSYGYNMAGDPETFLPSGYQASDDETLLGYSNYYSIFKDGQQISMTNGASTSCGNPVYVMENTYPTSRLYNGGYITNYNPWSAITSIVLTGTYEGTEGNFTPDSKGGFYLRNKKVVDPSSETQEIKDITLILTEAQAKAALVADASFITTKAGDVYTPITAEDVEFTYVPGPNSTNPANARYLKLADGKTATNYYINGTQATTLEQVNNALAAVVPARYYAENKAFFYIPLKHYYSTNTTLQYLDLKDVTEGNYGIVRNNWYELTVNKITGLGTGIGDPGDGPGDTPIPDPKDPTYTIDAKINVLQWHMRRQSVDL